MAITSNASATWQGDLGSGSGTASLGSGSTFDMTWKARAEEGGNVTPEELIAGAHASCFSMALSNTLAEAGHTAESLATSAKVSFVAGTGLP